MKILAVLWTVSLVRLCSAGCCGKSKTKDDDDGPYGGSKENLRNTHKPSGQSVASPQVKRGVEQSTNEASPEVTQDATTRQSTPAEESPVTHNSVSSEHHEAKPEGAISQDNENSPSQESSQVSTSPQPSVVPPSQSTAEESPKPTTPITLDLTKIDESKILVHTETKSEVTVKYHYPKDTSLDASKITTVMDGEKEVWKGADKEHALSVLVYYAKENSTLITIGINKDTGSKLDFKHFEKTVNGKWTLIKKEDYDQKLKDLKSGVTNPSSSSDPSTPS